MTRRATLSMPPADLSWGGLRATPASLAARSWWIPTAPRCRTAEGPSQARTPPRWIAPERCQIQIAYVIGVAHPVSLNIETFGTGKIDDRRIEALVRDHFDLRPGAIIKELGLRRPIYRATAAYGHFGRDDIDAPWETINRADVLRRAAGL